jgi:hypothetical protein
MKYFLYTRDMISTCFYSNSGYNSLMEIDPHALDEWIEIDADLYEQGMTAQESGQRALYAYNESGDKIASCTAISEEEAQKIMKEAEEKRAADLKAAGVKEEILTSDDQNINDAEAANVDTSATIIDASFVETSAAQSSQE